jgi:hypothetical protein
MSLRSLLRYLATLPFLLASPLAAQDSAAPLPRWHYWLTAGAGVADVVDEGSLAGETVSALAGLVTVQRSSFVASARWTRASVNPTSAWDVGLLAGLTTSPRYAFRGSVAAGVGRVESGRGRAGATLPVEVQLVWRLGPAVGVGLYAFGSFTGHAEYAGATLALQMGRLR